MDECKHEDVWEDETKAADAIGSLLSENEKLTAEAGRLRDERWANPYATRFTFYDGPVPPLANPIIVETRDGIGPNNSEVRRWVVTRRGYVWSKFAQAFVYEQISSDRTDEFIAETRFDTLAEALTVARTLNEGK